MTKPTDRRVAALRAAMVKAGLDGYIIPCSDPHADEFLPLHFTACNWFSGFTGDSCTFALTRTGSALWCDGRYFVQGEEELAGTEVALMKMKEPGVPTVEEYFARELQSGMVLGFDGTCVSGALADSLTRTLQDKGVTLCSRDIVSAVWGSERPALPDNDCWLLDPASAAENIGRKLTALREKLTLQKADAMVEPRLDCIAWLLELRAADIDCTPYALAFCWADADRCVLFADNSRGRFPAEVQHILRQAGVDIRPYGDIYSWCGSQKELRVLYDPASCSYALREALHSNPALTTLPAADPIPLLKAVRTEKELQDTRKAHLQDAVAMVRFQMELEHRLAQGEELDELDIDPILHKYRSAWEDFVVESFPTISAWGPNAASMHYHAEPGHHSRLERRGFLLVDSGATYRSGTTDITRTYAVGPLSEDEKDFYTWTLQSHIDMASAIWLDYCTGGELDTLAREPLWKHLINYRCGTGHGVAHVGTVHEGPQSLRPHNGITFVPGMIITDEPGVYEGGVVGIRIENELEVKAKCTNQYGRWLEFAPLTWVPIDLTPVRPEVLTADQKAWLNRYHRTVYEKLAPLLSPPEQAWLARKTAPLL